MSKVGFMQGRLSPKPADRIQAFPKDSWREEFPRARAIGFDAVELIYDELWLESNPLASEAGCAELVALGREHKIQLHSICSDYFMVRPLESHIEDARRLLRTSARIGCKLVEFPFVGPASLHKRRHDLGGVTKALQDLLPLARELGLRLALETDLCPADFRDFLGQFPKDLVGANLDMGNSAMWGWDAMAEAHAYGDRIFNVHIKDGVFGGSTVPVGTGHTDFKRCFEALKLCGYKGDFILQTCPDPDFLGIAEKYMNFTRDWARSL